MRLARDLVVDEGHEAVTMATVARLSGLSRPAIYQYFSSRSHILAELVLDDMADLGNELERLLARIEDPRERVRTWIHYSVAYLSTGEHQAIMTISHRSLPEETIGVIRAMHGLFMEQLSTPLRELGVVEPESLTGLIYAAVAAAAQRIARGADPLSETNTLEVFLEAGLRDTTPPDPSYPQPVVYRSAGLNATTISLSDG